MESLSSEERSVFSAFLKEKIKEKGWSVKKFAKVAGINEKYGYKLVSPKRDFVPGDEILDKILIALDLNDAEGKYLVMLIAVERKVGKPLFPGHPDLPAPPGSEPEELFSYLDITVRLSKESYKKLKDYADKEGVNTGEAAQKAIDGFLNASSAPEPGPGDKELEERMEKVEEKFRALRAFTMGMSGKLQETRERVELVMGAIGLNIPDYSE